jgi:hypothetical protein
VVRRRRRPDRRRAGLQAVATRGGAR